MAKKNKKARYISKPEGGRNPRIRQSPDSYDHENFVWRVSDNYIDYEHPEYGWTKIDILSFLKNIIKKLQDYEGLTWSQVKSIRNCHSCEVFKLPNDLQKRLIERELPLDELFQIGLGNKPRLLGYRELKTFYLMWYDPNHEIFPTKAN